ncbi:MAG: TatD family hydrolase [FCB group bacterium]
MIDTHAHIDFDIYDKDRAEVLQRAMDEGLEYVIIPSVEPKYFDKILNLTKEYNEIYCGMGIHPHNALEAGSAEMEIIAKHCEENKVVAIGETGIDYYYDYAPSEVQKTVFRKHLKIAKKHHLPVIVHNREADTDILKIIEEEQDGTLSGVLHCFSSAIDVMEKALELDFHISFTGNITFKKSNLSDVVKAVPLDRIMLETDSPFMTPVPNRGKRNEPVNAKKVAEKIAEIKSISIDEVISMTTQTSKKLFKLLILLVIPFVMFSSAYSQTAKETPVPKTVTDEDIIINPYAKFIGIGPILGFNTIVSTYDLPGNNVRDISFEGIAALGGDINYGILDYCLLEASFLYSKNDKITVILPSISNPKVDSTWIAPSIYNIFEISANWIMNPYSPVNFYGTTGFNVFFNSINNKKYTQTGLIFGLGFIVNLPTKYGLFNLTAAWKLDFVLQKTTTYYLPIHPVSGEKPIESSSSTYFSIPRVCLLWYPKF